MDRQERLRVLKASGYIDMISSWAREGCAPLAYPDPSGAVGNASMTFVDTGTAVLGLTAREVADAVVLYGDEGTPGRTCRVGSADLSPARFVARHPSLDLATFRLSHELVAATGHSPLSVEPWPPRPVGEGEILLFGGYPGFGADAGGSHGVAHVWLVGHAESAPETHGGMGLRIADSVPAGPDSGSSIVDIGGWSGGAVFRVLEQEGVAKLELAGVVSEHGAGKGLIVVLPLSSITPDGTFEG
jgi:hypothetical protein